MQPPKNNIENVNIFVDVLQKSLILSRASQYVAKVSLR